MSRARLGEADHVDDDVRLQLQNSSTKRPGLFFRIAIERNLLNEIPGAMRPIGCTRAATDVGHFEAGGDKARDEVSADMAASSNHDDAGQTVLPMAAIAIFKLTCLRSSIAGQTMASVSVIWLSSSCAKSDLLSRYLFQAEIIMTIDVQRSAMRKIW